MRDPLRYTRILPGHDLSSTGPQRLLEQLATPGSPRPVVFETWATDDGIRHLVGRSDAVRPTLRTLLRAALPDARTLRISRPEVPARVARLKLSPRGMPLHADAIASTMQALYAVFSGRRKGEVVAVQVVLGRGRRPAQLPAKILDPASSVARLVWRGAGSAPSETRARVAKQIGAARIDATVRVAVSAEVPERRRQLRGQLLAALEQLEAPGAELTLARDAPHRWEQASPGWSPIAMTASQITSLLGWPVDDLELPGLPSRHPRQLPPPAGISTSDGVFATATAPGLEHPVGLSTTGRLQHIAITGGTGSGKSEIFATLALEDIRAGRPLVLIEPKRQLVDAIVERAPQEAAGKLVVIDAAEATPVGFNPLDMGDRDPGPVIDGILEVFKVTFTDGWGPRTEDLLLACLATLDANGRQRSIPHTLLDLPKLLSDDGFRRSVIGAVAGDPTLAAFWATFQAYSPAQRQNIVAAPLNKLRRLVLRKNVAAILGQPRPKLRLRDIWKGDRAVLVPLNEALIGPGAAQLLGGLIVNEIWLATQERAMETEPQQRPGMVFIDEVHRYAHLPTGIDDALATSRSYGVGWHLATQGRAQLPKQIASGIELNARNFISFAASPSDAAALARTTTKLTSEDWQSLGRFEIYANLVIDGAPAGWFLARTNPPSTSTGHGAAIRRAYRDQFAGSAVPEMTPQSTADSATPVTAPTAADSTVPVRSSRKRRRS